MVYEAHIFLRHEQMEHSEHYEAELQNVESEHVKKQAMIQERLSTAEGELERKNKQIKDLETAYEKLRADFSASSSTRDSLREARTQVRDLSSDLQTMKIEKEAQKMQVETYKNVIATLEKDLEQAHVHKYDLECFHSGP